MQLIVEVCEPMAWHAQYKTRPQYWLERGLNGQDQYRYPIP